MITVRKRLYDPVVWTKYAARDKTLATGRVPNSAPPQTTALVASDDSAETVSVDMSRRPDGDWFAAD